MKNWKQIPADRLMFLCVTGIALFITGVMIIVSDRVVQFHPLVALTCLINIVLFTWQLLRAINQHPFGFVAFLDAEVFYLGLILIAQIIKANAVLLRIHQIHQLVLELLALGRIQNTLKHGILYPLAVIDAFLGNFPQAFTPGGIGGTDIVCN